MNKLLPVFLVFLFLACKPKDYNEVIPSSGQTAQFKVSIEHIFSGKNFYDVGTFDSIPTGGHVTFTILAPLGSKFSFLTKLIETNDVFYAPSTLGIPLYLNNLPLNGTQEVNTQVLLWDAGIYLNKHTGDIMGGDLHLAKVDSQPAVRQIGVYRDGFNYPDTKNAISVTIQYLQDLKFQVTITNLGTNITLGDSTKKLNLGQGVFVVHYTNGPFFIENDKNWPASLGLRALINREQNGAERLRNEKSLQYYDEPNHWLSHVNFSSGIWLVHNASSKPLFTANTLYSHYNKGLDSLIYNENMNGIQNFLESASAVSAHGTFDSLSYNTKDSSNPAKQEFTITARQGDRLSIAAKINPSTEEFLAFGDAGISLWNATTLKVSGDVSSNLVLYDLGSTKDQKPIVDTKDSTGSPVRPVADRKGDFTWPIAKRLMRVTITPL